MTNRRSSDNIKNFYIFLCVIYIIFRLSSTFLESLTDRMVDVLTGHPPCISTGQPFRTEFDPFELFNTRGCLL